MSTKSNTTDYIITDVPRTELTNTIAAALSRPGSRPIELTATLTAPNSYTVQVVEEVPLRRRLAATPGIIDVEQVQAGLVVV